MEKEPSFSSSQRRARAPQTARPIQVQRGLPPQTPRQHPALHRIPSSRRKSTIRLSPLPPFIWLTKIPLKYEIWFFAWIGAFGGILLIEAIMSTSTAFRDVYNTPTIVTSFGASAVLLFGVIESPVAQPRNFVFGHFLSALAGTCITFLFLC
ncbi:hypothetical protein ASPVEDRAFT_78206 [Aspergillus versicolor CBS 583.65]|uniref:HPP transmembrane region domain-containing protein n=1 Tax=Aspergillus versicolor CBS 583.65 TaxID=1036611 RepID=A0A1L9P4U1_ASPVE|nr:uncharacterized protein ASPVEDRAFT_78206 [Aspergillus versicolor CBS 583.65]OJI96433.1 hypothetical protein ASPVEDRAFT_78206 [Aspergillus versicolor CBS 583.65]